MRVRMGLVDENALSSPITARVVEVARLAALLRDRHELVCCWRYEAVVMIEATRWAVERRQVQPWGW